MRNRRKVPVAKKPVESRPPAESTLEAIGSLCCTLIPVLFVLTFVAQNFLIPSASMASTILVGDHILADRASLAPPSSWAPFEPYRPLRRGEPVAFFKPVLEADGSELVLVKRVVAIPGDRVHLRNGILYVNGVAQDEPYAAKPTPQNSDRYRDNFPAVAPAGDPNITATWALDLPNHLQGGQPATDPFSTNLPAVDLVVPPDCYFMMGDNRTRSLDSRYWGFVRRENLIGRPLFNYWSFPTPDDLDHAPLAQQAAFALHQLTHFFTETRWRRTLHTIN